MLNKRMSTFGLFTVNCFFACAVHGQVGPLPGLGGSTSGAASGSAAASANTSRLQSQMQQRIHAQAQAVQRAQSNAAKAAASVGRTMESGSRSLSVKANVELKATTQANMGRNGAQASTNLEVGANARQAQDEIDVSLMDSIFGRFNPFKDGSNANSTPSGRPTSSQTASSIQQNSANPNSSTNGDTSDTDNKGLALGVTLQHRTNHGSDVAARVHQAIRLRRAEIAQIRDQALATSSIELLAKADEHEAVLNEFVSAHAQASQQVQLGANSAPNFVTTGSSTTTATNVSFTKPQNSEPNTSSPSSQTSNSNPGAKK
ncbi:MAG: hypothetical protein U0930_03520 [Pirellulales bacterium]